jgi:cytochrome P450
MLTYHVGDMVHFDFAGTHLLIVNTVEAANSIMHGKGANYSDRPFMPFMRDLVGWGSTTVMSNDGPEFREHRRLFANALGTKASLKRFDSMVEGHTKQFLRRLMDNTEGLKVLNHVRRYFIVTRGPVII